MPTRRDIYHHFVDVGAMLVYVCAFLLLVFCFLAPMALCLNTFHTIWLIFPSLGSARPQCEETRQPRDPQHAFWPNQEVALGTISDALLLTFSYFVILLKLRSRVGGSAFLRVWVGPDPVFLHTRRL